MDQLLYKGYELSEKILIDFFLYELEQLPEFSKSQHWKRHIKYKDFNNLQKDLINFRNNDLSGGLDDKDNNENIKKIFDSLLKDVELNFIKKIGNYENIGNNKCYIKYKDLIIDPNFLYEIDWLSSIRKKSKLLDDSRIVCDIGGGYGSLISKIKKYNPKSTCILLDLPESNLLSRYFLSKIFPDKIFLLTKEKNIDFKKFKDIDFLITLPNVHFKNLTIDLVINTRSMMEMTRNNISKYFEFIHQNISNTGYFLNINAYTKSTVGETIELAKYDYDKFWKVIISKTSNYQEHIHFLLTQRSFSDYDIDENLKTIKELELIAIKKKPIILLRKAKALKYKKSKLFIVYCFYYYRLILNKLFIRN